MMNLLRWMLWLASKIVFELRYKVNVVGLDELRGIKQALILPNHPAFMDPPLVLRALWPALKPRPMLAASPMAHPLVSWIPKVLDAVKIPDLDQSSAEARKQTERAIDALAQTLHDGRNAILWPAGHLTHDGRENLGSSRSLAEILSRVPDANIILVKTTGLWGSRFSYAYTGKHPSMMDNLALGAGIILSNLLFFTPRRKVTITLHKLDKNELPELERNKLNRFFEAWQNSTPPQPVFVPYHFLLGQRTYTFPPLAQKKAVTDLNIKPESRTLVHQAFEQKFSRTIPQEHQNITTELDALGLDSLDRMELTLLVERLSGFTSQQVPTTLGDLYALAQGAGDTGQPADAPPAWLRKPSDHTIGLLGDTIPQAFVKRALSTPRDVAAADDMSGAITYEKMFVAALAMSRRFEQIKAPNVGVMLPASVASDIVLLALHLAGKLPVMINWTTGKANVDHAVRIMDITHVITSKRFMDRLSITIDRAAFLYLEDIKQSIKKTELLVTLLRVKFLGRYLQQKIITPAPDSPAVVLFTSGSEKAPKAVPLTHANILANLRGVIESFSLSPADKLLGFLPPFHSFGMSVTSLFPILSGLRVVHHPDPTAAGTLARKIESYKPTVVCGTPTFVSYILARGKGMDLSSVRLWVVGAEKCPPAIFEKVRTTTPNATIVEGYGITECSPLISVNREQNPRQGTIGQPLPGVQVLIVDHETFQPLPANHQGMILVSGPNVFPGYLAYDDKQPFHEHDGKRWYITGDLGELDHENFITFRGRLKRFLKAGGEMISLPAIEEPLAQQFPPTDQGPQVAVEGIETDKGRRIELFTTTDLTLARANALLMEKGITGVMRLDAIRKLDTIPMLGTGKTDYKQLRAMMEQQAN